MPFVKKFQQMKAFWGISFLGALALSYLSTVLFLTNSYGQYVPRKLMVGVAAIPFFFLALLDF